MDSFARAVAFVLEHEGEWSEDPGGGKTRWGISSRWHPDIDLDTLNRTGAEAIYRDLYWRRFSGDALPELLGLAMLDYSVLQGLPTAVRSLQCILGVEPDGVVGKLTLAAIDARPPGPLVRQLLAARKRQLLGIPGDKYRAGWLARLVDLALAI